MASPTHMVSQATPPSRALSVAVAAAWGAYLFVLPIHRVWTLPWFGEKLQPPELVFLGLGAIAVLAIWWQRLRCRPALGDVAAASWLAASLMALIASGAGKHDAIVETLGAAYLAGLYAAVRLTATPDLVRRYGLWFGYAAAVAAAFALAGVVLSLAGIASPLTTPIATPVPYVGHAARAKAFTTGPQMLASILLLACPLFAAGRLQRGWRRSDSFVLLGLVLGLAATVSKTAICVVPAAAVMHALGPAADDDVSRHRRRRRLQLAGTIALGTAILMAVGSRVAVVRDDSVPALTASQVVAGEPWLRTMWAGRVWAVIPTTYYFNSLASLHAVARTWPFGVGPAGQPDFTRSLQATGQFPASIWLIEPHSTYLGTAAELGAVGVAALVLVLASAVAAIRRMFRTRPGPHWEAAAYAGAGVAFLIEAISTDLMNCRHYWFLFAVLMSSAAAASPSLSKPAVPRNGGA